MKMSRTIERCPECRALDGIITDEDGSDCPCYAGAPLEPCEVVPVEDVLSIPLRETILAVLTSMPKDALPEHLAAMIENQVRDWMRLRIENA